MSKLAFKVGDYVKVTGGPFKNYKGVVVQIIDPTFMPYPIYLVDGPTAETPIAVGIYEDDLESYRPPYEDRFMPYRRVVVGSRVTRILFDTWRHEHLLDGDYGEFVKLSWRGEHVHVARDADSDYKVIPWIDVPDYYRAQVKLCVCPD